MICVVSRDLDRYQRDVDRADAQESALAEVESDLHARWLSDTERLSWALGEVLEAVAGGPDAAHDELYLLAVSDQAEFGHRLSQLMLDKLRKQAAAEAPDELDQREQQAIDDHAADRAADIGEW